MGFGSRKIIKTSIISFALVGALSSSASFARQKAETEPPMLLASCEKNGAGGSECKMSRMTITLTGDLLHIGNIGSSIKTKKITDVGQVLAWTIDKTNVYLFNSRNELTIIPIAGEDTNRKIMEILDFDIVDGEVKIAIFGRFAILASKDTVARLDLKANKVKIRKLSLKDDSGFKIDAEGNLTYCGVCVCTKAELDIKIDKKGA